MNEAAKTGGGFAWSAGLPAKLSQTLVVIRRVLKYGWVVGTLASRTIKFNGQAATPKRDNAVERATRNRPDGRVRAESG